MEARRRAEHHTEVWAPVRRGWCLGEAAFRQELLAQVSERRGAHHDGAELREGEVKAERLVKAELARRISRGSPRPIGGRRRSRGACGGRGP